MKLAAIALNEHLYAGVRAIEKKPIHENTAIQILFGPSKQFVVMPAIATQDWNIHIKKCQLSRY